MTRKSGKLADKESDLYQPIKSTEYLLSLANLATSGKLSTLCPSLNLYDNLQSSYTTIKTQEVS